MHSSKLSNRYDYLNCSSFERSLNAYKYIATFDIKEINPQTNRVADKTVYQKIILLCIQMKIYVFFQRDINRKVDGFSRLWLF